MKITVAGIGYVGLITAVCLAEKGHDVICVDIDETKISRLQAGEAIIYEQDLSELMRKNADRLTYTTDPVFAYQHAEVIFVGVGTPEKHDGTANMSYVTSTVESIANIAEAPNVVVVIKSTVPIGANDQIENYFRQHTKNNITVNVVSNPEFLAQGTAVRDTLRASRIVIGANSARAQDVMLQVYRDFSAPKVLTDRASAEMIKYASNNFLAVKISFINEIANLCEELGANIDDVTLGMSYDPRIGEQFLNSGVGYGGSCFPKDTKALYWISRYYDRSLQTVKAAIEINEKQKLILIHKSRKYYETFAGLTVAILGLTFKPGTDDLREAPSIANIPIFLSEGAIVKAYDPVGIPNAKKIYPTKVKYYDNIDDTICDADICFVFTEWPEIKEYDVCKFAKLMKSPIVMDGRRCIKDNVCSDIIVERIGSKPALISFNQPKNNCPLD